MDDVPTCVMCSRERTLADAYDYNPLQVVTGQPLGWYSGDDGEVCPECMTKSLRGGEQPYRPPARRGGIRMSEEPPTRERLLEIVDMIRSDCENDAQAIDRTPFTARGIGERFGETLALIHGLAGVVEAMAKALPPGEVTPSFDNQTPTGGDVQGWVDRFRPVAADRRAPAAPKQVPVSPPTKGKTPGAEPRLGTGARLAALSEWIDTSSANADRDPEAAAWGRLAKLTEEAGEVIAAFIGVTGQNPRKGVTHTRGDVERELLDVAVTALAAYEHMTGNLGTCVSALEDHIHVVAQRAAPDLSPTEASDG